MFRAASIPSGAAGSQFASYKFDKWKYRGLFMTGILLRIAYPITVTTSAWTPQALATLANNLMNAALGAFTLSYGAQGQYKPYVNVQGGELRTVQRAVLQRELTNSLPTTAQAVNTYVYNMDVFIPFAVPDLKNGRKRLPGFSQIRTFQIDMVEGLAYSNTNGGTAARTPGVNLNVDIDPVCVQGKTKDSDGWSPLLSYYKTNTTDFESVGPDGTHLFMWEDTTGFAATAIGLYSLFIDGDPIAEAQVPYAPDDRYLQEWVNGGSAIDDVKTVFLSPEENMDVTELPHGKLSLKLPTMYIATIQQRGIYWPVVTQAEAEEAARTASTQNASGALVTVDPDSSQVSAKAARTMAMPIYTTSQLEYTTRPGIVVPSPLVAPSISVPQHIKDQLAGVVAQAASSGDATQDAAKAIALNSIAKAVPGAAAVAASVQAAGASQQTAVIRSHFQRSGGVALA